MKLFKYLKGSLLTLCELRDPRRMLKGEPGKDKEVYFYIYRCSQVENVTIAINICSIVTNSTERSEKTQKNKNTQK